MTMAKSLGGGVAIGAMMAKAEVAASLVPGTHASTFGGNSLACAAAKATIEAIEEENLLANAEKIGQYTRDKLEKLKSQHHCIKQIRGVGLMIGIELNEPGAAIVQACWTSGLRINCTQDTILRFMPAMTVTEELIDQAVDILSNVMANMTCKAGA